MCFRGRENVVVLTSVGIVLSDSVGGMSCVSCVITKRQVHTRGVVVWFFWPKLCQHKYSFSLSLHRHTDMFSLYLSVCVNLVMVRMRKMRIISTLFDLKIKSPSFWPTDLHKYESSEWFLNRRLTQDGHRMDTGWWDAYYPVSIWSQSPIPRWRLDGSRTRFSTTGDDLLLFLRTKGRKFPKSGNVVVVCVSWILLWLW